MIRARSTKGLSSVQGSDLCSNMGPEGLLLRTSTRYQEYIIEREGECPTIAIVPETAVEVNDIHNRWSATVA